MIFVGRQFGATGAVASVALVLAACGHQLADPCTVTCGTDSACPEGLTCATDGFCHADDDPPVCLVGPGDADAAPGADGDPTGDGNACGGEPDEAADADTRDIAIPDGDVVGIDREMAFNSGCITVQSIQVRVEIVHEYRGDIEIRLTSPGGDTALLQDSSDDALPDLFATYDVDLFEGESADGEWLINVRDVFQTDLGTLQFWSIGINMPAP
jgi:hypothetical protein